MAESASTLSTGRWDYPFRKTGIKNDLNHFQLNPTIQIYEFKLTIQAWRQPPYP